MSGSLALRSPTRRLRSGLAARQVRPGPSRRGPHEGRPVCVKRAASVGGRLAWRPCVADTARFGLGGGRFRPHLLVEHLRLALAAKARVNLCAREAGAARNIGQLREPQVQPAFSCAHVGDGLVALSPPPLRVPLQRPPARRPQPVGARMRTLSLVLGWGARASLTVEACWWAALSCGCLH